MKIIIILFITTTLYSCYSPNQISKSVAKIERYKKVLGVKPCECPVKLTPTWLLPDEWPYIKNLPLIKFWNDSLPIPMTTVPYFQFNKDRKFGYGNTPMPFDSVYVADERLVNRIIGGNRY